MRTLQLTEFAKARISWQPRPALEFEAEGQLTGETAASGPGRPRGFVSVEAFIPLGARADHGLLGVVYDPGRSGQLGTVVRYCSGGGERWQESLAGSIDDVRVGLPKEYSKAVLEGLLSGLPEPSPGSLTIQEAAQGPIGSSPALFRALARAAAGLLFLNETNMMDDALAERLRSLLNY